MILAQAPPTLEIWLSYWFDFPQSVPARKYSSKTERFRNSIAGAEPMRRLPLYTCLHAKQQDITLPWASTPGAPQLVAGK